MYYKIRRILTWTLTAAVVLSSNSVTVLAENEDFSEFQDVEEDVSVTEDEVDFESETEIFRQPDIQTDVQEEVFQQEITMNMQYGFRILEMRKRMVFCMHIQT